MPISLPDLFASNQLVSGGLALAIIGVAAVWLRDVPVRFARWARHFFVATLTIDSRDELLFPALPSWTKPDPLRLASLKSIPAFADPGRPAAAAGPPPRHGAGRRPWDA